MRLVFNRMR